MLVLGAVSAFADRPRSFSAAELRVLSAQARLASSVLSLRHTATHDALTGIANRARGAEFALDALKHQPTSVMFIDINDFKKVNDRHGHQGGDECVRSRSG